MNNTCNSSEINEEKKAFYELVYTSLSEAIKILEERQKDKDLIEKIDKILNNNIPEPLKKIDKNGVLFRQVATPNFEARWFIELTRDHGLKTNFFEYHSDKFTSNNYYKHSLGQLRVHKDKHNKNGDNIEEKITIVDFAKYDGKKLKEVYTTWNEPLISFHKKIFDVYKYNPKQLFFYDITDWLKISGEKAVDYYTNFILLFICRGILFENFLFADSEGDFTKKILLPAFKRAQEISGIKPLVVPIPPMDPDIEEDMHWHSYHPIIKSLIKNI